jgi:regulator of replication initiation timing
MEREEEKEEIERVIEKTNQRTIWTVEIEDIFLMKKEIDSIKNEMANLKLTINSLNQVLSKVTFSNQNIQKDTRQTIQQSNPTDSKLIEKNILIQQTAGIRDKDKNNDLELKIKKQIRILSNRQSNTSP